jgi:hypothetical protein
LWNEYGGGRGMTKNEPDLAGLAGLAHRALNDGDSEYARNKVLIAQFFGGSPAVEYKEEVRLTLVDSLYSTNAAYCLYSISDIAQALRSTFFGDSDLKTAAARWIADDFDRANPLHDLFAAKYGVDKSGESVKSAASLLSKYLYFATGYSFPIYDALGAEYHYIAGKKKAPDFQRRFHTLKEIMEENAIDGFDQLDNLFWLYGKVRTESFSLVLNAKRYTELTRYTQTNPDALEAVRTGKNIPALRDIFGPALYDFIRQTNNLDKE